MKTVRRFYFYLVAFISLEAVLWGLIGLLRSILDNTVGGTADTLAGALALILVGVPIFLFHWLWVQRTAAREEEEQSSSLRAIFFYAVLLSTLVPLVQNLLALLDRSLLGAAKLGTLRAVLGGQQTLADNLIAIAMNGVVAGYFWKMLREAWARLKDRSDFLDVRRLYRYVWVLYSLLIITFGAQQILRFLFYVPSNVLGELGRETMINGLALLLVGTPVWYFTWRIVQNAVVEASERESNLRLGILYILSLGSCITVLTTLAMVIHVLVRQLLGARLELSDFVQQIGGPASVGLPLAAVWIYHAFWLNRHIESAGDAARRGGMKRVYFYILSAIGLGSMFAGVAMLVKFVIDISTGGLSMDDTLQSQLASAISLIAAWLPLWLWTWRPVQDEALGQNDAGDHARRSVVRKVYLYLALFAGVIGGMIAAVALAFQLIKALLTGEAESNFLATLLNNAQLLILFAILLAYHLNLLRRDGVFTSDALAAKQTAYPVLVFDSGAGFADAVKEALTKYAPHVPVAVSSEKPQDLPRTLILSGSAVLNAPEWVRKFNGNRLIVPDEAPGVIWAGGVQKSSVLQAAQAVRQLAEEQELRPTGSGGSAWRVVVYIAAALFGLELVFMLLGMLLSTFIN